MGKDKSLEQMTLEELTAYSAKLYGQLYALKSEIQIMQQWRNRRQLEADIARNRAEEQARLDGAIAATVPPTVIHAQSIKSDEGFGKLGGGVKKFTAKIVKTILAR